MKSEGAQETRANHLLHALRMLMEAVEEELVLDYIPESISEVMEYCHLTIQQDRATFEGWKQNAGDSQG